MNVGQTDATQTITWIRQCTWLPGGNSDDDSHAYW